MDSLINGSAFSRSSSVCIEYYGYDIDIITMSREHNDANVLSIGERFVNYTEIIYAIKKFLEVPFSDEERHNRRINKIKKYEGNK